MKRTRRTGNVSLRGAIYWMRYSVRGEEIRESTGETDERKAQRKLNARLDEKGADRMGVRTFVGPKGEKITVGELLDAGTVDYTTNARKSLTKLLSRLAPIKAAFGDMRAVDLTATDVEQSRFGGSRRRPRTAAWWRRPRSTAS